MRFFLPCKLLKPAVSGRCSPSIPSAASWVAKRMSVAQSTDSPETPPADCVECLENFGITKEASNQMLSELPARHIPDKLKLSRVMAAWSACQFGQENLAHLLATNPGYLLLHPIEITNRYSFLSSLFSQKFVYKIIANSPQIFNEKDSSISSKLDFTQNVLKVSNSEVVNSQILSYPIEHLRLRHEFLKRCGLYKTAKGNGKVSTNPSLKNMFSSDDQVFSQKVARLSLEEFEVFKNLYELEDEDESEEEDD